MLKSLPFFTDQSRGNLNKYMFIYIASKCVSSHGQYLPHCFLGMDDQVRCFTCDGGLRSWDPEDDPWIEHCRWFPACPFLREMKGVDYIELVQQSIEQGEDDNAVARIMNKMDLNKTEFDQLVSVHRETIVKEMGYKTNIFEEAIEELRQQGLDFVKQHK